MNIGITYDLKDDYLAEGFSKEAAAEFDRRDTIEALEGALHELGYATDPIGNIRTLAGRLVKGDRWDLVFNIAEGVRGFGREAQVPALLEAFDIPYTFSDPMVLALTLHKGMTKRVIRDLGLPTPDFQVVEKVGDLRDLHLPFPLFLKPVAEGTGKGITGSSRVTNRKDLFLICEELLETFEQPVIVETFLPGREFTVGITGTGQEAESVGVIEVLLRQEADPDAYSYRNKENYTDLVEYRPVRDRTALEAARVALASYRGLGCRDAGRVDLRADSAGIPNFIEINPLAGLHPDISDLPILCRFGGMTYLQLIGAIMVSASARTRLQAQKPLLAAGGRA